MLPSFTSIRERNLRTLYGDGGGVDDRSPKGSVDVKIRPLVDLINRHPDYVTLSSCSGRVALFDPTAGNIDSSTDNDATHQNHDDDDNIDHADDHDNEIDKRRRDAINGSTSDRTTNSSGKGHGGKWIFVTHDILPDLGTKIIDSLKQAGRERLQPASNASITTSTASLTPSTSSSMIPITFKHEPPLLHVAACNLESGMRLLRIIKSAPHFAMRESGLVVTDKRVTVEIRTTSTMLTLPIMVRRQCDVLPTALRNVDGEAIKDDVILAPDVEYLMSLSEIANERMIHNEALIDGLFSVIQREIFGRNDDVAEVNNETNGSRDNKLRSNGDVGPDDEEVEYHNNDGAADNRDKYNVTLQSSLPPLNLWKTAVVVLPNNSSGSKSNNKDEIDLDVLAFGGQGVGPNISTPDNPDDDIDNASTHAFTTCKRWDAVFRLRRQGGLWSKQWDILPTVGKKDNSIFDSEEEATDPIHTAAGIFWLTSSKEGMGRREGHTACVIPRYALYIRRNLDPPPDAVILFGGRTSGGGQGLVPTNDLFVYVTDPSCTSPVPEMDTAQNNVTEKRRRDESRGGLFGVPLDVRGDPPEPRYGHTMSLLPNKRCVSSYTSTPFAVVAGGTGISSAVDGSTGESSVVCLNSIYTLSCIVEMEHYGDNPKLESHLMWNRIADMPSPRSFHTSVVDDNDMFVFGGYAEADDPFVLSSPLPSWCAIPLDIRNDSTTANDSEHTKTFASIADELPLRIGSSTASLALESNTVVLLVGGAKSTSTTPQQHSDHSGRAEYDPPLTLLAPNNEQLNEDDSSRPKEFARVRLHVASETEDVIDLGSCVHHCLVALPHLREKSNGAVITDDHASAIVVGGGVPCFSFGQAYAR
jgi:tRNA(Phe) wybutosine-synthesizing methylase Tyw3